MSARCLCIGQKRPFAMLTLTVISIGMIILIGVNLTMLYHVPDGSNNVTSTEMPEIRNASALTAGGGDLLNVSSRLPTFAGTSNQTPSSLESQGTTVSGQVSGVNQTEEALWNISQRGRQGSNGSGADTSTSSSGGGHVSLLGALGMVGFTLADHGYDASFSTVKAYMLAVTPASQHDSVLVYATLLGAVGGCLTSLLGFLDLTSVFPKGDGILDKGVAQCLLQAVVLLASILVLGACSLLTGSESNVTASVQKQIDTEESHSMAKESEARNGSTKYKAVSEKDTEEVEISVASKDTARLVPKSKPSKRPLSARALAAWKRHKSIVQLCVMTFLGLVTNYAYFVYVSNYVAEVIFNGDPYDVPGSTAYANYVQGIHVGSLSMLTFYCVFVVFNVFHSKILEKVIMRTEYILVTMLCAALTLTLALTDSLIVLFVNALTMAAYRSVVYTIPFILSNNYSKQEHKELLAENQDKGGAHNTGVAMATITAMVPASYFVVSLVMGPLMEVTGSPGTPIFISSGACILSLFSIAFVKFD